MWWGLLSHVHVCVPKAHQKKISMVDDCMEGFEKPQHCQNWRVGDCPGQYGSTCSCCVWLSRYVINILPSIVCSVPLVSGQEKIATKHSILLQSYRECIPLDQLYQWMQCGNKVKLAVCTVTWDALTSCSTLMVAKEPNFEFKQCLTWLTAWL